jgi:ribosomal protein S1
LQNTALWLNNKKQPMPIWDTAKRWINDLVGGNPQTEKPHLSESERATLDDNATDFSHWEEEKGQGTDADFPDPNWAAQDTEAGPDPDRDWTGQELQSVRERRAALRKSTIYQPGQELECAITGIQWYGIFLEMPNGEPALAPKAEAQVKNEDPVTYQVGQMVKVLVMSFNPEYGLKVSIARCLNPYRYNRLTNRNPGDIVQGVVRAETDTGHVVILDNGETGLVKKLKYLAVREVPPFDVGDTVRVKLLEFKPDLGWRMSEIAARSGPPLITRPEPMYIGHIEKIYSKHSIVRMPDQSWARVSLAEFVDEACEAGQQVKVFRIKSKKGYRWSFSPKETQIVWDDWARTHPVGTQISCTIKAIADYGVFVRVAPGLEGLVHGQEMYLIPRWVKHGFEDVHIGQRIDVIIEELRDDPSRRLKLRLVNPLEVGQIVEGTVVVRTSKGLHVRIAPGVHATWTDVSVKQTLGISAKAAAKVGDTARLKVARTGTRPERNLLEAVAGESHLVREAAAAEATSP